MNRLSFFPVGENVSSSEEELKLFVTEEGVHLFDCPLLFNGIVHLGCESLKSHDSTQNSK